MSVRETLRELVSELATLPGDDDALSLDSLSMVTLVEAIEDRFAIRVAPREVNAKNFGSIAKLAAYVESKKA